MSPIQNLRTLLGLPAERTADEVARDEARFTRLRSATPREQLDLRRVRLRAAGWDASAHGNDPLRLAGSIDGARPLDEPSGAPDTPPAPAERPREINP